MTANFVKSLAAASALALTLAATASAEEGVAPLRTDENQVLLPDNGTDEITSRAKQLARFHS